MDDCLFCRLVRGEIPRCHLGKMAEAAHRRQFRVGRAGEVAAVAHLRTECGDRPLQPFQQLHPVGQSGQAVVGGLVGQLALGAHALAHLLDQLGIGFGQFAGNK